MAENSTSLWRTIAMGLGGLLVGLGGSMITVEIRLAGIRADLAYQGRAIGELQGVVQSRGKELESLRLYDAITKAELLQFDRHLKEFETRITRVELSLRQTPKELR